MHGAYAHLHQHTNDEVADTIADAAGPSLPKVWDPLCLAIPYQYLLMSLFEPPDCYFGWWITIAAIVLVYMIPLCQGEAYLISLCLFPLPPTARPRQPQHHCMQRAALAMRDKTLRGHTAVSFDTNSIPFIIDKSATCIITNERS